MPQDRCRFDGGLLSFICKTAVAGAAVVMLLASSSASSIEAEVLRERKIRLETFQLNKAKGVY